MDKYKYKYLVNVVAGAYLPDEVVEAMRDGWVKYFESARIEDLVEKFGDWVFVGFSNKIEYVEAGPEWEASYRKMLVNEVREECRIICGFASIWDFDYVV
jgi:hypothetical protein